MAEFIVDEDLLPNVFNERTESKKKTNNLEVPQDSDDKEVEDLFRDSCDSEADQLDSLKR